MFASVLLVVASTAFAAKPAPAKCQDQLTQLADASPLQVPAKYVELVKCDAEVAKKNTASTFSRMIAGEESHVALTAAVDLGLGSEVRTWVGTLEPDQQTKTVSWMGSQCATNPKAETFLIETWNSGDPTFWSHRWYRGFESCQTPGARAKLTERVTAADAKSDRQQFFSLAQVFARNLHGDAIPTLAKLVEGTKDEEELANLIANFADAANVGAEEGVDDAAAKKASSELQRLAPTLPPRVVDQVRRTLLSLGDAAAADGAASLRWPERLVGGKYRYGVTAVETATCKNGSTYAVFHHGEIHDGGKRWPDQIQEGLNEAITTKWALAPGKKCKGDGSVVAAMTTEPTDDAALGKWLEEQQKAFDAAAKADKVSSVSHDPVQ